MIQRVWVVLDVPGDTVCSQRVGYQQLQPFIGPYGGQWTMCALPKQMHPHPHSELSISVQITGVSESFQTDQCTLWGNLNRGSDSPSPECVACMHLLSAYYIVRIQHATDKKGASLSEPHLVHCMAEISVAV